MTGTATAATVATVGDGTAGVARSAIEYCAVRVVPDLERGECLNVGVLLVCRPTRFLDARISLDLSRLTALWPALAGEPLSLIEVHLATIGPICAGDPAGGPIAALTLRERWHWLTSPASTVVQPGPVHTGLTTDPAAELDRLFGKLVAQG